MSYKSEPWEFQYIQHHPLKDYIAWNDFEAWQRYPKHSWVYDKQALATFTHIPTYDLERELPDPAFYPYVIKPRTNFDGLSKNMYIASSEEEIEHFEGMIAQKYLTGHQGTADVIMQNGVVRDTFAFTTHKNMYGEIVLFSSNPFFPVQVRLTLEKILRDYTGILNVEYIESDIIEIHLRPSLQFYDICNGFIDRGLEFVKSGKYEQTPFVQSYSKIYRTRLEGTPYVKNLPDKPKNISSLQLCWEDDKKLIETDPSLGASRYLVINGFNLQDILKFGKLLKGHIFIK